MFLPWDIPIYSKVVAKVEQGKEMKKMQPWRWDKNLKNLVAWKPREIELLEENACHYGLLLLYQVKGEHRNIH